MATIEAAAVGDLQRTSELHRQHLGAGIFPRLGLRFLRRYHESFLTSPAAVALTARQDGEVVGFLLGTVDNAAHYGWTVRHRGARLALSGMTALLLRPSIAWSFARTRLGRYVRGLRRHLARRQAPRLATDEPAARPVAVLTHVATAEQVRRAGIGRGLVEAFLAEVQRAGASEVRLVTTPTGDAPAFYDRTGWEIFADRTGSDGTGVREYRRALPDVETT